MAADDTSREALVRSIASLIHESESEDWPDVAADPAGGCLGGDRCKFVATAVVDAVVMPLVEERDRLAAELDVDLAHQRMDAEGRDCPVCTHMAHEGAYDELDAAIKRAEAAEAALAEVRALVDTSRRTGRRLSALDVADALDEHGVGR